MIIKLILSLAFCASTLSWAAKNDNDSESDGEPVAHCEENLGGQISEIPVTKIWEVPHKKRFKKIGAVNGMLIQTVADFFKSKRRFPMEFEVINLLKKAIDKDELKEIKENEGESENLLAQIVFHGLKVYFSWDGSAPNLETLYRLSFKELHEYYGPFRTKVAKQMASTFAKRLRFPSLKELAEENGIIEAHLRIVIGNPDEFVRFVQESSPREYAQAKNLLARAFLEDMRQSGRPQRLRTRSTTPDIESLVETMERFRRGSYINTDVLQGDFGADDLRQLLGMGQANQSDFSRPVLFPNGIEELEAFAKKINPTAFQAHVPTNQFGIEEQRRLVTALENSRGALVATYGAGFPLEELQMNAMLKYAEDRDFVIILVPEIGILDGVDRRFLDNPRVFVLTHTIENSRLKLWNVPINPKQINPFSSLDITRHIKTGQTAIVGSPQQIINMIPRVGSDLQDTTLWSPGSVMVNAYPSRLPIQGRTAEIASGRHQNGFLVIEKSNSDTGPLKLGSRNTWFFRNVEVVLKQSQTEDGMPRTSVASFNDLGNLYVSSDKGVSTLKKGAKALVLGDLHDHVTLQAILPHLEKYIRENPDLEVVILHDPLDGYSHNRHEMMKMMTLMEKIKSGQLDLLREYLNLVQTVNAILSIRPNLEVVMVDSNHSYWGKSLVENPDLVQRAHNGEFLAELQYAMSRSANKMRDPLHYMFDPEGRELHLSRLSEIELRNTPGANVRVIDPNRVSVLKYGSIKTIGKVVIHLHGHLGANGAKGSARALAAGAGNAVTGDSHRSARSLDWMSVGTLTPKKLGYNDNGISSWNQSWGLIYENGEIYDDGEHDTKQLIIYDATADAYHQDPGKPILLKDDFFGEDKLTIRPNANELFDSKYKVDQHSIFVPDDDSGRRPQ